MEKIEIYHSACAKNPVKSTSSNKVPAKPVLVDLLRDA